MALSAIRLRVRARCAGFHRSLGASRVCPTSRAEARQGGQYRPLKGYSSCLGWLGRSTAKCLLA